MDQATRGEWYDMLTYNTHSRAQGIVLYVSSNYQSSYQSEV